MQTIEYFARIKSLGIIFTLRYVYSRLSFSSLYRMDLSEFVDLLFFLSHPSSVCFLLVVLLQDLFSFFFSLLSFSSQSQL